MGYQVPPSLPKHEFKLMQRSAQYVLNCWGWKITGQFPNKKKLLIIVAPHTSNWDFIISMLVMFALNLRISFMGKSNIFIWPLSKLLKAWGGIAIDRSHPHGTVGQMTQLFQEREQLVLGLAPEGTRSKTVQWKKGFLHIALKSNTPIVPVSLDFKKKEVAIMPAQIVSSDIDGSLEQIKALYQGVCAKNPHLV